MMPGDKQQLSLSTAVAVFWLVAAAGLMVVGISGIADQTEYARGLEVLTEVGVFAGPVFIHWFSRKTQEAS